MVQKCDLLLDKVPKHLHIDMSIDRAPSEMLLFNKEIYQFCKDHSVP